MNTRRFRVTVDGETYEVEIEELVGPGEADEAGARGGAAAGARFAGHAPVPPARRPAGAPPVRTDGAAAVGEGPAGAGRPAREETRPRGERSGRERAEGAARAGRGEKVEAPLPGTVLSVNVKAGQEVSSGEVLVVLEAMKMQNEIVSPRDGTVSEVAVEKGDTVALGDLLVRVD